MGNCRGLIRAALAAALAIALAACASTSLKHGNSPGAPTDSGAQSPGVTRPPPDPRVIMVDHAKAMIGQPYRWGGAAPGGFDCSGLVAYAAEHAGVPMPRTAHEQLHAGMPIARSQVHEGDLVFMHLAHKELHVGIAIDDERFIHAPSTGGRVRIDSLAAPPYSSGFMSARRIIIAQ
ncbi:MAG TPA: C40 family peptidase [Steroidobacteraceae bacterium]